MRGSKIPRDVTGMGRKPRSAFAERRFGRQAEVYGLGSSEAAKQNDIRLECFDPSQTSLNAASPPRTAKGKVLCVGCKESYVPEAMVRSLQRSLHLAISEVRE